MQDENYSATILNILDLQAKVMECDFKTQEIVSFILNEMGSQDNE